MAGIVAKQEVTIRRPGAKFTIGLTACACAVLLPKFAAYLGSTGGVQVISVEYVAVALVFCAIVGVVMMWKEWGVARKPWDTFMTALALPAVFAGMVTGLTSAQALGEQAQDRARVEQRLGEAAGVPIRSTSSTDNPGSTRLRDLFETPVYADSAAGEPKQIGMRVVEPRYWVVFDRERSRQEADQKLAGLRNRFTTAGKSAVRFEVVPYAGDYLVVEAGGGRRRSDALVRAVDLKRQYGLQVQLQQVPGAKGAS